VRLRGIWVLAGLGLAALGAAQSRTFEARLVSIRGDILTLDTPDGAIQAEVSTATRAWYDFRPCALATLPIGQTMFVKASFDRKTPLVREIADIASKAWLDRVRRETLAATVRKFAEGRLDVAFADGRTFQYRVTDKSEIATGGMARKPQDLTAGATVYVRGRLLSNGDTWLYKLSDVAPAIEPPKATRSSSSSSASGSRKTPAAPLPSSGKTKGVVTFKLPGMGMFDLNIDGVTYHFRYVPETRWTVDGKKAEHTALELDLEVEVWYRRDRFGRLIVSRVAIP